MTVYRRDYGEAGNHSTVSVHPVETELTTQVMNYYTAPIDFPLYFNLGTRRFRISYLGIAVEPNTSAPLPSARLERSHRIECLIFLAL